MMEAMELGYPAEKRGQISVTATKGEWQTVIGILDAAHVSGERREVLESLVNNLIFAGVYE